VAGRMWISTLVELHALVVASSFSYAQSRAFDWRDAARGIIRPIELAASVRLPRR